MESSTVIPHPPMLPAAMRRVIAVRELPILVVLILIVVGTAVTEPRFLSADNTRSILVSIALLVVLAMGETVVLLTRGVDVSIGSMTGLAGMMLGVLFRDHYVDSLYLGTVIGILIGAGLGAVNGALVTLCRVPPIIATLGTMGVYRGLTFVVSTGKQVDEYQLPAGLAGWSVRGPFGQGVVPWVVVVALCVAATTAILLRFTRIGRRVYAVGGNPEAARLRGIAVARVTFGVYVFSGATAGLAGVLYASRLGAINPEAIGAGMELMAIAAVVVGGVSIFGGSGTVLGVLLGCLLLGTIETALAVLGVADAWQKVAYGGAILLAVVADGIATRRWGGSSNT
jgi:rhamnose transport system permease protein